MKLGRCIITTGVLIGVASAAVPAPASAVGSYTIKAPARGNVTAIAFSAGAIPCNSGAKTSPLNGVDAVVVDVASVAGKRAVLTWSGKNVDAFAGTWTIVLKRAGCASGFNTESLPINAGQTSGSNSFPVPAGAAWALISTNSLADVSLTVRAA